MQKLDAGISNTVGICVNRNYLALLYRLMDMRPNFAFHLYGAKLYLMDDGRWLILDYLKIPDAPRHYIDCIEGDICNMNVRIISDETKREIEKNQEIFDDH